MLSKKPNAKKQTLTYAAAMLAVVLWASSFPGTRYVLQYYSPVVIMLMRFSAATATLIIVGLVRKIRLPKMKDLPMFVASGLSGVFLYSFFFNTGSVTVEAGVSSFIIAASPVFTLCLARVFLKEVMRPMCWIGMGVSIAGLAAVTLTQTAGFVFNTGVLLMIAASVFSGAYSFVVRVLTKTYTALEVTVYTMIFGTVGMFAFLPDVIREVPESNLSVNLIVVFLGIFPAGIAYLAWGYALSKADKTAHVTVFSYLIPFVSTLIGFVWLRETLTAWALAGGLVIIAGMMMTNIRLTGKNGQP